MVKFSRKVVFVLEYTKLEIKTLKILIRKKILSKEYLLTKLSPAYFEAVMQKLYKEDLIHEISDYVIYQGSVPTGNITAKNLNKCKDIISKYNNSIFDKWFTRGIAFLALIISIIALLKQ